MATRPNPYVKKDPGDIMLASDWNEMQVQTREELAGHRHTGGADAAQITRDGIAPAAVDRSRIAPGAVDGSLIDPQADVTVKTLKVSGTAALTGGVMLGAGTPRTALDTGSGLLSGAANDYQKAQVGLSGGGLVTWSSTGYLKWTNRFIAISAERSSTFSRGYVDIACPTNNPALVKCWDGSSRANGDGVQLRDWEALYAVHEVGGDNTKVSFQIVSYSSGTFHAPGNWLLVAVVNSDDRTIKLGTGATVSASSSYASASGSSLPRGAIIMWAGDTAPAGWALCDGQNGTPDLRGRFVLSAGQGGGLTPRTRGQVGGEERHQLSYDEMPSHGHGVSDPGHRHQWTASRQLAGTDDNNNSTEFSKGDRSTADTIFKDTDARATGISIQAAGGNQAHENMPPFYVLAYIMKL